MIRETQALHPDLRVCRLNLGFHSPDNRVRLDDLLDVNALQRKGWLSGADREHEEEVEAASNTFEHLGHDRVRSHGSYGFGRNVTLARRETKRRRRRAA